MIEQGKLAKVIEGLDACLEGLCEACSYRDVDAPGGCKDALMYDAFALLKAQEPRVMTLEEYEAWIDTPFTERNPVFHEELTKRGAVTSWVNTTVCSLREYGKNDRCWTSRPDNATREETPWE